MTKPTTNKRSWRNGQPKPKPRTTERTANQTKNSKNLKKLERKANKLIEKKRILKTQMLALDVIRTLIGDYRQTQLRLKNQIEVSMAESVLRMLKTMKVMKEISLDYATAKAEREDSTYADDMRVFYKHTGRGNVNS